MLPFIVVKPGDPFTGAAVRDGIATLYLKGLFKDIRVEASAEDNGVRLEYILVPVTIVDTIVITGNHALSTGTIMDAIATIEGKELRDEKLSSLKDTILALYQAEGFYETGVTFRPEPLKEPNRVALHVEIRESEPTVIEEITFSGNAVFTDRELLRRDKEQTRSSA